VKSRAEIFSHVTGLMAKMFALDPAVLREDARLYDDFDIDSIDAVDLMVELSSYTGKKIGPEDFRHVRSIGDIVNALEALQKNG
jgi:acyl carrier protein